MVACLIHVGQPKTGTTSIQSTLFWGPLDPRFRLLSLDSDFGNRLMLCAFRDRHLLATSFFLKSVSAGRIDALKSWSRRYLHDALTSARRRGVIPVISAEAAWGFSAEELEALRRFVVDHGFEPRVICYLRPPADLIETDIQQLTKMGNLQPWASSLQSRSAANFAHVIPCLDAVFGEEAVSLYVFDPERFPDRSVVRHFCAVSGIAVDPTRIRRDNDSLSLPAIRFLHTFNVTVPGGPWRHSAVVKRAILKRVLPQLAGPRLTFHPDLIAQLVRPIEPLLPSIQGRLGRPLPLTLLDRDPATGLRDESELFAYCPASLEWLCRKTGRPLAPRSSGIALAEQVGRRLSWLASRSLTSATMLVRDTVAIHARRRWLTVRSVR